LEAIVPNISNIIIMLIQQAAIERNTLHLEKDTAVINLVLATFPNLICAH
jgi:hypothetical protein